MGIESVKAWQWAVVGLAAGLGVAAVRVQTGASAPVDERPGIVSYELLEFLASRTADDQPAVRGLTVYPPLDGKVFVTGEAARDLNSATPVYRPFQLNTVVPFRLPRGPEAPRADYSIRDYLAEQHPDVGYTYAWWTSDAAQYALWGGGATVAIGVIWPLVLRLLIGAGLSRQGGAAEPEYDLDRFGREKADTEPAAAPGLDEAAVAQSEAATEALERDTEPAGTAQADDVALAPSEPAPVVALSGGPLEPVAGDDGANEPKDYKGEFYPVARTPQKHES